MRLLILILSYHPIVKALGIFFIHVRIFGIVSFPVFSLNFLYYIRVLADDSGEIMVWVKNTETVFKMGVFKYLNSIIVHM